MRTIRYAFWAIVAVCLIMLGLANRDLVTVQAMPDAVATLLGRSHNITVPLFVVIFAGVALGLFVGFVWEWLREYGQRAEARARTAEIARLQRELGKMQTETSVGKDEVLALLDAAGTRR